MKATCHFLHISLFVLLVVLGAASAAQARDAAFLEPGNGSGTNEEAVRVEPKPEVDVGETTLNVAKRVSVFFVNQTNTPVKIENIAIDSDSNVNAEATANDCTKQGSIDSGSRCSVEISVTAVSPGSWSVDVLMTHNGPGRIARARLTGKTSGMVGGDKQGSGLAMNAKENKPVDFGDVTVGDGKIVRSALMVNDSADPITIYSIDVIEADNGLKRLDQGCAVDMELAPGASCPVTLLWVPKTSGPVSTDLIIRHSGRLGFAVIPIRGVAKGGGRGEMADTSPVPETGKRDLVPLPPSAAQLEKEVAGKVAPVSSAALESDSSAATNKVSGDGRLHLIGTVGERALFLQGDGDTSIVSVGSEFAYGGKTAKLVAVKARSVEFMVGNVRKTLPLEAAAPLVDSAARQNAQDAELTAAQQKTSLPSGSQSVSLAPGSLRK